MPALHGSKARMYLSGWDITGSMRSASFPSTVDVADSSTWGMTSKRYVSSDRFDATLKGDGVWDFAAAGLGGIDELLIQNLLVNVATWLPQGDGFGNRARFIGGGDSALEFMSPGSDVTGFSFEVASIAGAIGRGRVLQPLAGALNITVAGNSASLDEMGALPTTSIKGIGAALHVINKGGSAGTLTVRVQHSPDQSVWTDIITFGGKTVKNVAEYAEVTGTVQRYLRAIWTLTAGSSWDFSVVAGRK